MHLRVSLCAGVVFCLGLVGSTFAATLMSVNDFEDGSVHGWSGDNFPTNIPTGGPNGVDDNYMELTPSGTIGPGGNLAAFNLDEVWVGNYAAIGASAIEADFLNATDNLNDLPMRIVLIGPDTTSDRWTSTEPFIVPNDGEWHRARFELDESSLTRVGGISSYDAMMQSVLRVLIRLDPDPPSFDGEKSTDVLGVDNLVLLGIPGDKNGDGAVDAADAGQLFAAWGTADPKCDLNGDGIVDAADAGVLFTNWTGDHATIAVPEPHGIAVWLAFLIAGCAVPARCRPLLR